MTGSKVSVPGHQDWSRDEFALNFIKRGKRVQPRGVGPDGQPRLAWMVAQSQ